MPEIPTSFDFLGFFLATHQEADVARTDRVTLWRKAWDLYHNRVDFSKKAKWQSQEVTPEFAQTVDTASDLIKGAMIEARDFYTVEGEGEEDKQKAPFIKRLTDLHLRLANFTETLADGIKLGGIADLIPFRVTWPEWDEDDLTFDVAPNDLLAGLADVAPTPRFVKVRRSGLKIELVDPFRLWIDPTGRNRYVIEETVTDLDELRQRAKLAPDAWDAAEIARLEGGCLVKDQEDEAARRAGLLPKQAAPWRREVTLRTYWGDVVDKDGTSVGRDMTFAVATSAAVGGQYVVGRPRQNPYWHKVLDRRFPNKRGPILWGSLFRIPLSPMGKGFAADSLGLAKVIINQVNNLLDQDTFAGINAFEVDVDAMSDPEQLKDGIYPGIALLKRGDLAGDRQVLTPRVLGQVNPQSITVLQTIRRLYQNATGVTEYVSATEPSRAPRTLGEYRGRQSQAMGKMDAIARGLEDSLLEPVLETVYWLIIQYMDDFSTAAVREALGEYAAMLAGVSDVERFNLLKASVRFHARGLSVVLAKAEEVQKVAMLLQTMPALVQAVPGIAQTINWQALFRKVIEGLNWDPDEVLVQPQQAAMEQEALAGAQGMPGVQMGAPVQPDGGMGAGLPPEIMQMLQQAGGMPTGGG